MQTATRFLTTRLWTRVPGSVSARVSDQSRKELRYASRTGSTAASTAVSSISSCSSGVSIHHLGVHSFDVRALITGHVWYHDHHEYIIEVTKSTSPMLTPKSPGTETPPMLIQRRYRAFHRLHRRLVKMIAADGDVGLFCDMPRLPPKRYFGSKRRRFVARRQRALQTYRRPS